MKTCKTWLLSLVIYAKLALGQSIDCSTLYPTAFGDPTNPDVCYYIPDRTTRNWEQTVTTCSGLSAGGYTWSILEIKSFSEDDFLQGHIRSLTSDEPFWVGQNDRDTENVWKYITTPTDCATTGVYLHWQELQPNGNTGSQSDQDCVAFFVQEDPGFQDKACSDTFYSICKTDTTSVSSISAFVASAVPVSGLQYADCSTYLGGLAFSHPSDPSRCYGMTNLQVSYQDAINYCTNKGAGWGPVNIEDVEENDVLFQKITVSSALGYWIGQNDISSENVWTYKGESNCDGVFYNFDSLNREPDGGSSKNCVVLASNLTGKWIDEDCASTDYHAMCKLQQQPLSSATTDSPVAETTPVAVTAFVAETTPVAETTQPPASQTTTRDSCSLPNCLQQWYNLDKSDVSISTVTPRLASIPTGSTFRCSKQCTRTNGCISFLVNMSTSLCELFSTGADELQFSRSAGSKFFVRS